MAIDCALFFENRTVSVTSVLLGSDRSECNMRPFLARAEAPRKLILSGRKGRLYFFSGLPPGRYEVVKFRAISTTYQVEGKPPTSNIETYPTFEFSPGEPGHTLLAVDVTPGSVTYLGRVDVIKAREPGPGVHLMLDTRPLYAHYTRDREAEADALLSLRKAARGGRWESRLASLPDSAFQAAVRDTIWEMP